MKRFSPLRRAPGFTLIELAVVVVIIAVLAGVALPTFLSQRTRAQDRKTQSNLHQASKQALTFYLDNGGSFGAADGSDIVAGNDDWVAPDLISVPAPAAGQPAGIVCLQTTSASDVVWTVVRVAHSDIAPIGEWVGRGAMSTWCVTDGSGTPNDEAETAQNIADAVGEGELTAPGVTTGASGSNGEEEEGGPSELTIPDECIGSPTVPELECAAVVDLYNELNVAAALAVWGEGWSPWLVNNDPCTWGQPDDPEMGSGQIICSGGHVTGIYLYNLSGEIPASVGTLTNLADLVLVGNISAAIPTQLAQLSNLTTLTVYAEGDSAAITTAIGNLTGLTYLNLAGPAFTGSIPAEIGQLSNLTTLLIHAPNLTGTLPIELGELSNLSVLQISNSGIGGSIPAELANLSQLTDIWLNDNELSGEIPLAFASFVANGGYPNNPIEIHLAGNGCLTLPEGLTSDELINWNLNTSWADGC